MEPAAPVSRAARLVRQPEKMVNFIHEISDYMETSQPAFTIFDHPDKQAGHFHIIPTQVDQPIRRDRMLFWTCAYLEISQKKVNMAPVNASKYKWMNNLC